MKLLKEQAQRITSLEIQGATNIAKFAVNLLKEFVKRHENLDIDELYKKIEDAEKSLISSRDTEPAMCNGLRYVTSKIDTLRSQGEINSNKIAEITGRYAEEYMDLLLKSKKRIAEIGANRIPKSKEGFMIMTHCHSSVTTGILTEAHNQGKRFTVICTETRPRFQGRLTAKELTEAGIHTIMIVDSAMRWALRNYDISFILCGADAITSEGTVLNKIGSRLLALAAREMHIPFYIATPLLKFNPKSAFGNLEKIDMRDEDEVWKERPKNLEIKNPSFETISRRYIDGLITEVGIFPATVVQHIFEQVYPSLLHYYEKKEGLG
ncbi:MAG: S-methyl-5-thioribose-1-phosphate isomerase [Promethearchaeota archaeon]